MDIERARREIVGGFVEDVALRGFGEKWKSLPEAARDGILTLLGDLIETRLSEEQRIEKRYTSVMVQRDVATTIVRDVRNMLLEERLPAGSQGILNRIENFFNTPWGG
jgi:hypothetical protein